MKTPVPVAAHWPNGRLRRTQSQIPIVGTYHRDEANFLTTLPVRLCGLTTSLEATF